MFKPNRIRDRGERGSLLAAAFMISMALAVSMVALISFSKTASHHAESVLIQSQLGLMAQEKFKRDLFSLTSDPEVMHFSTTSIQFPWGEAQSTLQPGPEGLTEFQSPLYLVVVATISKNRSSGPHHLRLDTILEVAPPPPVPMPSDSPSTVPMVQAIEDQLRTFISEEDPRFEEIKQQIFSALEEQFGAKLDSLSINIETNQYRESSPLSPAQVGQDQTFYMTPVSIESIKSSPRVRLWKETYY